MTGTHSHEVSPGADVGDVVLVNQEPAGITARHGQGGKRNEGQFPIGGYVHLAASPQLRRYRIPDESGQILAGRMERSSVGYLPRFAGAGRLAPSTHRVLDRLRRRQRHQRHVRFGRARPTAQDQHNVIPIAPFLFLAGSGEAARSIPDKFHQRRAELDALDNRLRNKRYVDPKESPAKNIERQQELKGEIKKRMETLIADVEAFRRTKMIEVLKEIKSAAEKIGKKKKLDLLLRTPTHKEWDTMKTEDDNKKQDKPKNTMELVIRWRRNPVLYLKKGLKLKKMAKKGDLTHMLGKGQDVTDDVIKHLNGKFDEATRY